MSTPVTGARPGRATGRDLAPRTAAGTAPPVRFGDLVAAEWIKIRSLRSTPWLLGLVVLVAVGAAGLVSFADYDAIPGRDPGSPWEPTFALHDAFPPEGYLMLMLAAGSLGAIAVVSEYGSGLIRTTTVAVPARGSVILAKAAVQLLLWTVVGAVTVTCSYLLSWSILDGRDAGIAITAPGAPTALAATVLLGPVCALVGLGLGTLIRHAATTVLAGVLVLLILPTLILPANNRSTVDLNHMLVLSAWQRLTRTWGSPSAVDHYASYAGSWTVYALWPLVAVALALVVVRRRDV
ncbi:ABC transporter permease [Kitasatospora sp. NBC_00240]|uniref:ABC transporter permease n=1 Tax=Kitasatospora sp. NBC_00240 TaxID=2903567 RepID=UPI0022520AAB|nr:ABC transporter permease [Kitasatospora sp. NBC_00240]MCX5210423.1 ABC transporter permease [Kitasatospora sp. NBC_00240]